MFVTHSFQFRSGTHPQCRPWFSQCHSFAFSQKGTFSSCDLELWPTTLTYKATKTWRRRTNMLNIYIKRRFSCEHTEHAYTAGRLQYLDHRVTDIRSWLVDWVKVLCPTQHKTGHFGDVSQANLLALYGKTKPNTTKAHIHQSKEMYYNTTARCTSNHTVPPHPFVHTASCLGFWGSCP